MAVARMLCVSSTKPDWFTPGAIYDSEPRGADICICGDNLVSDLNKEDWYEMSQRADGLWFLIGFQQAILFRGANHDQINHNQRATQKRSERADC